MTFFLSFMVIVSSFLVILSGFWVIVGLVTELIHPASTAESPSKDEPTKK